MDRIGVFYVPTLLMYFGRGLHVNVAPIFVMNVLGKSETIAGVCVAMIGLGKVIADIPAGYALRRCNSGIVMVLSSLLMLAGCLISGFCGNGVSFIAAGFFVFGAGIGSMCVSWQMLHSEFIDPTMAGGVAAYQGLFLRVGLVIATLVGPVIFEHHGISALFFAKGSAISLCLLPLCLFAYYCPPGMVPSAIEKLHSPPLTWTLRKYWKKLLLAGGFMSGLQLLRSARSFGLTVVGRRSGMPVSDIATLLAVSYLVEIPFCSLAGSLIQKSVKYTGTAVVITLASSLFISALGEGRPWLLWIGAVIAGIGNGVGAGIGMEIGSKINSDSKDTLFAAVWRVMLDSGELFGPLLLGAMLKKFSLLLAFGFVSIFAVLGVIGFWFVKFVVVPCASSESDEEVAHEAREERF